MSRIWTGWAEVGEFWGISPSWTLSVPRGREQANAVVYNRQFQNSGFGYRKQIRIRPRRSPGFSRNHSEINPVWLRDTPEPIPLRVRSVVRSPTLNISASAANVFKEDCAGLSKSLIRRQIHVGLAGLTR